MNEGRTAKACLVSQKDCITCHMPKVEIPGSHFQFTDHRIRDASDYAIHKTYLLQNPVRKHLCERAEDYPYSSAHAGFEIDDVPQGLKPVSLGAAVGAAKAAPFQNNAAPEGAPFQSNSQTENKISNGAKPVRVELEEELKHGFFVHYDNGQTAEVSWSFIRELPPKNSKK